VAAGYYSPGLGTSWGPAWYTCSARPGCPLRTRAAPGYQEHIPTAATSARRPPMAETYWIIVASGGERFRSVDDPRPLTTASGGSRRAAPDDALTERWPTASG
jgi:hypothetical protein